MIIHNFHELVTVVIPAQTTMSITDAGGNEICHCDVSRPINRPLDLTLKITADMNFPISVDFTWWADSVGAYEEDVE